MRYVDGFVVVVPEQNLKQYKSISQKAGKLWKEFGALEYVEAVGDDLNLNFGRPFPKLAKVKEGETVVFSFIVYNSRKDRDRINDLVMKDPRMQKIMDKGKCPFDTKKMSMGGFKALVDM
jgi:uncharacterized protein YbaA (DUF1428 family)